MLERLTWLRVLGVFLLSMLPAVILSLFLGFSALGWLLAITFALLLLRHSWQMMRLSNWLWCERRRFPPIGKDSWEPIFYGLHHRQLRHQQRQQQLISHIARFRRGIETLPDALVILTQEGNISWCNQPAQQLLNLRWPEDQGQALTNLLRSPRFIEYFKNRVFQERLIIQRIDESQLEIRILPYSDGQWLLSAMDVTEKQHLAQMQKDFLANVSHELRTPLTVLCGYVEMMNEEETMSSMQTHALSAMQHQTQRMVDLVNQLLQLSRLETMLPISFDSQMAITSLFSQLQKDAESLNQGACTLTFHPPSSSMVIYGESDPLRSALSNLIYNAIRHAGQGSCIDIVCEWQGRNLRFSVRDNGVGIDAEHLQHLTDRFYRVESDRSRRTGGSGLGLAIVKQALQPYRSQLEIKSQRGEGSEFSFMIAREFIVDHPHGDDKLES